MKFDMRNAGSGRIRTSIDRGKWWCITCEKYHTHYVTPKVGIFTEKGFIGSCKVIE